MGSGRPPNDLSPEEEKPSLELDLRNPPHLSSSSSPSTPKKDYVSDDVDEKLAEIKDGDSIQFNDFVDVRRPRSLLSSSDFDIGGSRRNRHYEEIMQGYETLQARTESLKQAKQKILSYEPGAWIEEVGGMTMSDYAIPETTTLMLIGPRGSGKSSLLNRISRVFENDKFASDRAQVSHNLSVGDGTSFLQEYMIPRGSTSFCIYDTRSLAKNNYENFTLIKSWMTNGVRHGQLVMGSDSLFDDSNAMRMKWKVQRTRYCSSKKREVNFVIFVIDGLSVLKSMDSDNATPSTRMLATTFNCSYLSFEDDKPVVVVTHGDELSLPDRARIRMYLGELLGIPPAKQIFDIPDKCDPATELTIVEMLRYSLEHADRHLPFKRRFLSRVWQCGYF
eukprot:TRINITY_DN997_c0_g1_i4.p1 TRINITY_DN997_c0_g1~~TRINITY_DN997_c0_g1_i4.p1  ORF type:complete len:391 (+),score=51.45 TRINITY_DN997_c0_g1_i4:133-1305(+)